MITIFGLISLSRCGTYPNLPPQCKLQRDPKDYCCFVPICDWNKPTPNPYITPSPQSTISPQPGVSTNSPPQGSTLAPKLCEFLFYQEFLVS